MVAITAVVGGQQMSKQFSDTSTAGKWDGNVLLDTVSSSNLGLVMPGAGIDHVAVTYDAGCAIWRIQSAQTLVVKRSGMCQKAGYVNWHDCSIPSYRVAPDDILVVYPLAVDATANQSNCLSWVHTSKGQEAFGATDIVDATPTAMTSLVNGQTLGDVFFNSRFTGITIQVEDGATLNSVSLIDAAGGNAWTGYGGTRLPTAGGTSAQFNFKVQGMGIAISKGWTLKVTTTTA